MRAPGRRRAVQQSLAPATSATVLLSTGQDNVVLPRHASRVDRDGHLTSTNDPSRRRSSSSGARCSLHDRGFDACIKAGIVDAIAPADAVRGRGLFLAVRQPRGRRARSPHWLPRRHHPAIGRLCRFKTRLLHDLIVAASLGAYLPPEKGAAAIIAGTIASGFPCLLVAPPTGMIPRREDWNYRHRIGDGDAQGDMEAHSCKWPRGQKGTLQEVSLCLGRKAKAAREAHVASVAVVRGHFVTERRRFSCEVGISVL
mmetsp:Transcript_33565/g.92712  ORF Transcript_33565/g.92712 Transcript_33565/m.92712 type:complete len:256 (+) Transcript_33565:416-1183(+)